VADAGGYSLVSEYGLRPGRGPGGGRYGLPLYWSPCGKRSDESGSPVEAYGGFASTRRRR